MKEYFYEVHLSHKDSFTGLLRSPGLTELECISPETPLQRKNQQQYWTPEQLLGAAVSTCFMGAFIKYADNSLLELSGYQSQCFIKIEKTEGQYTPVGILLRPVITLNDVQALEKAGICLEKAEATFCMNKLLTLPIDIDPQFEFIHSTPVHIK